jgi:predicted double-glycine peptidase
MKRQICGIAAPFPLIVLAPLALSLLGCSVNRPFDITAVNNPSGLHLLDFQHIRQKEPYDCGAGALAIVFTYWGKPAGAEEILREIFADIPATVGMTAADLKMCAEKRGFYAFLLKMSVTQMLEQIDRGRPVIVCRKMLGGINHYEVIVGYDETIKRMILADPAGVPYSIGYQRFAGRHKKVDDFALLVVPRGVENHSKGGTGKCQVSQK